MAYTNNQSSKKEKSPEYWVKYAEDKFNESKNFRSARIEKQWMINWTWYKGFQNLKYNTKTRQLVWDDTDPLKFYVNKIYSGVRAVRGAVTKYNPTWDVDGLPYESMDPESNQRLGDFMLGLYDKLGMKHKTKQIVLNGSLYGIGVFEYGYDAQAEDGQGELWVESLDPFDVYIDPLATSFEDARYVVKVMRKPTEYVKNNPNYKNTKDLGSDKKLAASEYKSQMISKDYGSSQASPDSVLVYETWCRLMEDGVMKTHIVTTCAGRLLRQEELGDVELPFIGYFPDVNQNEIYGEGWVKNLVPINRAINYLERNNLEYHMIFAKGKFMADSDSNVKIVTNENGQIIRKPRGTRFEQLPIQPMTSSVFNQLNNLNGYFAEVGAINEAFMGKSPTGVTAGVAIEQLVSANMGQLSDLIDNLEITLSELGERLLDLAYKHYDTTHSIKVEGARSASDNSRSTVMSVVGQGIKVPNALQLPARAKVKVRIVSGLAYTKQGKEELLFKLRNGQDVDRRTLLEQLNLDADKIEARLVEERAGQAIDENGQPTQLMQAQDAIEASRGIEVNGDDTGLNGLPMPASPIVEPTDEEIQAYLNMIQAQQPVAPDSLPMRE